MKQYERESLFKNFFVFFSLLELLLSIVFIQYYHTKVELFKSELLKNMQVCSYTFDCKEFKYDFSIKDKVVVNKLYSDTDLYSFYELPKSKKYYLKVIYPQKDYISGLNKIKRDLIIRFLLSTFFLFLISLFFTFYTLRPIRKALQLNDEFVKDILHDFNTPIATMKLNIKMLNDEVDNKFAKSISYSMDAILQLQSNLKSFLFHSPSQKEKFDIVRVLRNRIRLIKNIHPNIKFIFNENREIFIDCNKDAMVRILDNLLLNAAKYNKKDGEVNVNIVDNNILIKDSGKGIKDTSKVFERYYKEQSRGLGLGLHIVKKLCDELGIKIVLKSKVGIGTTVSLDLGSLI